MHMIEALEKEDAKRWKEHEALTKVAKRASIAAEYLHGVCMGTGGSKILYMLDKALAELEEAKK